MAEAPWLAPWCRALPGALSAPWLSEQRSVPGAPLWPGRTWSAGENHQHEEDRGSGRQRVSQFEHWEALPVLLELLAVLYLEHEGLLRVLWLLFQRGEGNLRGALVFVFAFAFVFIGDHRRRDARGTDAGVDVGRRVFTTRVSGRVDRRILILAIDAGSVQEERALDGLDVGALGEEHRPGGDVRPLLPLALVIGERFFRVRRRARRESLRRLQQLAAFPQRVRPAMPELLSGPGTERRDVVVSLLRRVGQQHEAPAGWMLDHDLRAGFANAGAAVVCALGRGVDVARRDRRTFQRNDADDFVLGRVHVVQEAALKYEPPQVKLVLRRLLYEVSCVKRGKRNEPPARQKGKARRECATELRHYQAQADSSLLRDSVVYRERASFYEFKCVRTLKISRARWQLLHLPQLEWLWQRHIAHSLLREFHFRGRAEHTRDCGALQTAESARSTSDDFNRKRREHLLKINRQPVGDLRLAKIEL
eukprot:scaffold3290_cov259-Pinguiococcus_pyrenoidosus.AAC.5